MSEQPPETPRAPAPMPGPTTGPLHRPYRRLSPLTPVVRSGIVVFAAAWTILRDLSRGGIGPIAAMFGVVLVAGAVYGIASWVRTKFWIEADELRVDTGVISRQSRRIRIDRLQGIDIAQPLIARAFGLAELRMDVAGGHAREGALAFLPVREAHELKDLLLTRRDQVRAAGQPAQQEPAEGSAVPPAGRVLARVGLPMLVASILLSPEPIILALIGAGLLAAFVATGEWLGLSAMLPVLLGFGVVVFKRFSGNYGFTVSETTAGLQVRRGLFDLSAQTITVAKLQGLVIREPLMWRRLGWARLDVSIAGYDTGGDDEAPPSTVLPVGHRGLVLTLARDLLGGVDPEGTPMTAPPPRARWVAPVGRHFLRAGIGDRVVVSREGWFVRRTCLVPHARTQSLRLVQGPVQRRLGLADLRVDSPPGPVGVAARHRQQDEARAMLWQENERARQARLESGTHLHFRR